MPEFNTFRMNKDLVGESFAFRRLNPCLDTININDPEFNKSLKVKTINCGTYETYDEWVHHILNVSKVKLENKRKDVK